MTDVKVLKGRVSINRVSGGDEPVVRIEVIDDLSGSRICEVEIGMEGFGNAVTGLGHTPCSIRYFSQAVIGMKAENKEEIVPFADRFVRGNDAAMDAALAPFEVDGWRGRRSDLTNGHRATPNGQRVTFFRHVEVGR